MPYMWAGKIAKARLNADEHFEMQTIIYVADTLEETEELKAKYREIVGKQCEFRGFQLGWNDEGVPCAARYITTKPLEELWPNPCPRCERENVCEGDYLCETCRYG